MDNQKSIKDLVDFIAQKEYGSQISHKEIEKIICVPYRMQKYNSIVASAKKHLLSEGKMITSVRGYGYQIVPPDDYSHKAVRKIISGGRRISAGKRVLQCAPIKHMTEDGKRTHQLISDRVRILEAAVAGATTEVRMLDHKRNPLLPENIQK